KGDVDVGGYSGSAGRIFGELVVRNGIGSGTLTSPGCSLSPVAVTISAAGDVSGQSEFACVVGGNAQYTGRLTIAGRFDGTTLSLLFWSERGGRFRLNLPRRG